MANLDKQAFYDKVNKAYRSFHAGKLETAEVLFEVVLREKPEHTSYLHALADIKYALHKREKALVYYGQIISILGEDTPNYIVNKLLKTYRELVKEALEEGDEERAITFYREMIEKYPDRFSYTDVSRFTKLVKKGASHYDEELIHRVQKNKTVPKPPFKNADRVPLEVIGIFETRYKPWHSRFCPDGSIFSSAKYCRPPRINLIRGGSVIWEQSVDNISRGIVITHDTIVLLTHERKGLLNDKVIVTYDYQGNLIGKSSFKADKLEATPSLSKTKYLLRAYKYENDSCQLFILSPEGKILWEGQQGEGFARASMIPLAENHWFVANGYQCFVLDGEGNCLFEYSAPAEEKVIEYSPDETYGDVSGLHLSMGNHFKLLGIEPTEDKEGIKKAYRAKTMQWHPDRNPTPQATDMMKELNRVYAELIKSPISLSKVRKGSSYTLRYTVLVRDYFLTAVVDPIGEECWLGCSSGKVYSFKSNRLTEHASLGQRVEVLGFFEHDRSLLVELENKLYILKEGHAKRINWDVQNYAGFYHVLNDPLNRYQILMDGSNSLFFIDENGRVGTIKFTSPVQDVDFDRKQNLIGVAADKLYFLRLNQGKQLSGSSNIDSCKS